MAFPRSSKGKFERPQNVLCFASFKNDYGDNHHLWTRDITPENSGSFIISVIWPVFALQLWLSLHAKEHIKIMFLCKLFIYIYTSSNQRLWVRLYLCVAEFSMFDHLSEQLISF